MTAPSVRRASDSKHSSILLKNAFVVTVDEGRTVLPNGWVAVDGDQITALGDMGEMRDRTAEEVIDLHGMLLMPGLVNGHNHHWGSLFKNVGEGLLLEPWRADVIHPLSSVLSNEDLRTAAYLGAIEQIRTGTTCSLNHVARITDEDAMAAMAEPVVEVGIRQLITKELRDTPNPPFSNKFPAKPQVRTRDEELALAEALIDRWDGRDGVVHMGLAIETGATWMFLNVTSTEVIVEGVELARRHNLKITNHCSSGTSWLTIKDYRDVTGGGDVDYLVRLGVFTDNWVLAHGVWLTSREIEEVARAGASVVSNPVSTAYTATGVAPLREMFEHGVNVGLGTDGAYCNCSPDMVEQMKFAALLQNVTYLDPTVVSAERAIEMATINSAKALGLDHLIGSIEVGKRADLVAFDLEKAHVTVANRPVSALVFSAHGTDADCVLVNGKVLMKEGELVGFPAEDEVLADARRRAHECIVRAGLSERVYTHWRHVGGRRVEAQ